MLLSSDSRSGADRFEVGIDLVTAELGLHLAEFLGLGLAPPDRPSDGRDPDQADQTEEPEMGVIEVEDRGDGQQRDHVHDLDQGVQGRAGGVFERVADGIAGDRRLVRLGPLAAIEAVLDRLLGVVPGAAGVGHEDGEELADDDHARQVAAQGVRAEIDADQDRHDDRKQCWAEQLALRRGRADVHNAAVVGGLGAGPDLLVAELGAALLDDQERRSADGPDRASS